MSEDPVSRLLGLSLLGLVVGFGSIVSPILPQFAEQLGASYVEIGLFFSAYSFTWSFLQLYSGYLSDRYGRKKFIMLGLSIYGLSLILIGFSQNFMQLILFRVLQGLGLGLFAPACLGLVAQVREKGRGFALYRTANSLGDMAGPIMGGVLGSMNIVYPFFTGGLLALFAISAVFLVHEEEGSVERREGFIESFRGMVLTKKIILICVATFTAELTFVSLGIIIPLFGSYKELSPVGIGIILSSYFVAFTLFQIPIGILSEKINKKSLIGLCSFSGALPFILLSQLHEVFTMSLAMGILGITLGTVFVQSSAYIAEMAPEDKKSLYMAFFDSIIDFSFIVMPPIATYSFAQAATAPFFLCASLMIVAGLIFMKA